MNTTSDTTWCVEITSRMTRFTGMILPARLRVRAPSAEAARAAAFTRWMEGNFDVAATPAARDDTT